MRNLTIRLWKSLFAYLRSSFFWGWMLGLLFGYAAHFNSGELTLTAMISAFAASFMEAIRDPGSRFATNVFIGATIGLAAELIFKTYGFLGLFIALIVVYLIYRVLKFGFDHLEILSKGG